MYLPRPRDDSDELQEAHDQLESALERRAGQADWYMHLASEKTTGPEHRRLLKAKMKVVMAKWRALDADVSAKLEACHVIERRIVAARSKEP